MKCPKCHDELVSLSFGDVEVDRCIVCKGLWFENLEDDKPVDQAQAIDTGDAEAGRRMNAGDRIRCPKCPSTPLLRTVDPKQPHVWFESCPSCHGRFFDAGEFRDYGERSFLDLLRAFRAKERA